MRTQAISTPDADNRISNGFGDDHDSTGGPGDHDDDRSLALHNDDHDETPEEEEAEEVHEERWKEGRGTFLTCFPRGDIPYKWRVRNITTRGHWPYRSAGIRVMKWDLLITKRLQSMEEVSSEAR